MALLIDLPDPTSTERAGAAIAPQLAGGMVITLSGDLGAGKTTLVRGMLRGLGWSGPVKSPSYSVVEHYPFSSIYFYHFDFYRFADPDAWEATGLAECFRDDSVGVIEWPERGGPHFPLADLALTLTPSGEARRLAVVASTPAGNRCLDALAKAFAKR